MHHLGLICPEISGHLNPMTTLGRKLQQRGFDVSLIGKPDGAAKAKAAGLGYLPIGAERYPVGRIAEQTAQLGAMSGAQALHYTVELLCDYARVVLEEAPQIIQKAGIEALLVDEVSRSGGSVAEALGLPFVSVSNALCLRAEPALPPTTTSWPYDPSPAGCERNAEYGRQFGALLQPYLEMVNTYRAEHGLGRYATFDETLSPLAHLVQQPACFDFPRRQAPAHFHYTGPFHDDQSGDPGDFPLDRLDGRPLIYASMGTVQNKLQFVFPIIAAACAELDAQLVISLGRKDQPIPESLPGAPLVVPYAPQLALLKRASLVITHAGLNTVLESLAQGVPSVAIPIANDQPGVAARLSYLGVGEFVPISELSLEILQEKVSHVFTEPSYRQRAQGVQREIAQADGLARAAEIVMQALGTCERGKA